VRLLADDGDKEATEEKRGGVMLHTAILFDPSSGTFYWVEYRPTTDTTSAYCVEVVHIHKV
jgi:hypothetical protein